MPSDIVDASRLQNIESMVPLGSGDISGYPVEDHDPANKLYVDNQIHTVTYAGGPGVILNNNVITLDPIQTNITQVGTLTSLNVSGPSSIQELSLNGNKLLNVAMPTLPTDGSSKAYVDGVLLNSFIAGTGLTLSGNTFSVADTLPTLSSLSVSGVITMTGTPSIGNHVINKTFAENLYQAGDGLVKNGTTFSVAANQSQITSVGTLTTLTVSGP